MGSENSFGGGRLPITFRSKDVEGEEDIFLLSREEKVVKTLRRALGEYIGYTIEILPAELIK